MSRRLFRNAPRQRRQAARTATDTRAAAAGLARARQWASQHLLPASGVLILVLLVLLGGILLLGNQFRVHEVQVVGANLLEAQALRDSAGVLGRSILAVHPAKVEATLYHDYVMLESVSLGRKLPDVVIIRVKEHAARWAWESGGRYWWLRADGTVIGEMPSAGKLVVIHDINGADREPAGYIPGVPWELADAMLKALPEIPAYDYSVNEGLIVYVTENQWPVFLGTGGDAALKTAVLRELVKQLSASHTQLAYIDLRNEARPVFRKQA